MADDLAQAIAPAHTALAIHDMQNDFCLPGGKIYDRACKHPEMIAGVLRELAGFTDAARAAGVRVVYLQQMHIAKALDLPESHIRHLQRAGLAASRDEVPCIVGSWGHRIVDALKPKADDIVIDKAAMNDFHNSMVDKVLRFQGVQTVLLTGVSSHAGILGTFFGLIDHGYEFYIPRECVTGYKPELHEAALKIMGPHVVSAADVTRAWGRPKA